MEGLSLLLATVTGVLAAAVVGFLKKVDTKITGQLGNLTPIIVTAATVGLPLLAKALHIPGTDVPNAATFVNAPLATIVAILSREASVWVKARYGSPPAP